MDAWAKWKAAAQKMKGDHHEKGGHDKRDWGHRDHHGKDRHHGKHDKKGYFYSRGIPESLTLKPNDHVKKIYQIIDNYFVN